MVHNVVQAQFEQLEHVVAGDALHVGRLQVVLVELLFQHTVDELNLLLFLQLRAVFRNLLTTAAAGIALRLLFAITHFRRADAECTALPGDGLLIDSHVLQSSFVCLHATALGRTAAVMRNRRHVLNHAHVQTSGL